ncbi:cytochrome d ubiquinol oxidase subunit I [Peribacillus deserti]|uniref:Cytochrome d ubiquinol oxidase subunit I n=1 Tax=Peribacillus deserti TaxID=673318 RepID=A0ABS2QE02_9BACI|nr:cytochrome ubiquinol oxidase subunit I [Peribacillus deserti]MBM7691363.1 cytochrome d ubiquinol oxidase subunit I [Peribacillus deserti]
MTVSDLVIARAMFGTTMAFHIIFATLGIGIPFMILISELLFLKTKDQDFSIMAKRWTKAKGVLLGIAIPSGTIAGVSLSLLWPGFMEVIGRVMALPFQIEIYAFFIEALFLSIYVYAYDRISAKARIISLTLVTFGALASGVLISNVHAFESTPAGFRVENGHIVDVDPWAAFFNPSFYVTAGHVALTALMTGAFVMGATAAYKMLRNSPGSRSYKFHSKALVMSLVTGGIIALLSSLNGHASAQHLHEYQPEKLAAAEGLFETQSHAPLLIGGTVDPDTQEVKWGIEIPWALSFLAGNSFDTVVRGLNEFPREHWPPLFVHTMFNGMVGIGMYTLLIAVLGVFWIKFLKKEAVPKWLLWAVTLSGPLSVLAIEFGWILACTGRQPWTIYHVLSTADSVTSQTNLGTLYMLFVLVYLLLGVAVIAVLYYYFKRHPLMNDLSNQTDGDDKNYTVH